MHLRLVCHGEVQHKALNVMGPLSRVWSTLEDAIAFEESTRNISRGDGLFVIYRATWRTFKPKLKKIKKPTAKKNSCISAIVTF